MFYGAKVRFLGGATGHRVARRWNEWRSGIPRAGQLSDYFKGRVSGASVADVGCMWNINGALCFLAEELGAIRVVGVDLWKTPEFEAEARARDSKVQFFQADATEPGILKRLVGQVDLVWCFGVLYHVPDPIHLLVNLRQICLQELILETVTIPEVPGISQAACFFPYLRDRSKRMWENRLRAGGLAHQAL